ncbi:MAG TPA: hypothetical protein VEB68_09385 [Croceibacterium sp.]|nr:hypothetical protein [Croceibacterium sp.]
MSSTPPKPFRIARDEHGQMRLTVRETRYNSQGYPWVIERLEEATFPSAAAARAFATEHYGAVAGEFSTK